MPLTLILSSFHFRIRVWTSSFSCGPSSIPLVLLFRKSLPGDLLLFSLIWHWWIQSGYGQPQTGGGDVLKQLNCTVVGLRDWAGLRDEQRWTLCTLGARFLPQLLDTQYDTKPKACFGWFSHPAPPHTCWILWRERGEDEGCSCNG